MKKPTTKRNEMEIETTIIYLQSAMLALSTTTDKTRPIVLMAQAGLTTRRIAAILRDHGHTIHWTTVARIIRENPRELPISS